MISLIMWINQGILVIQMLMMSGSGKETKKGVTNLQPSFMEMTIYTLCLTLYFLMFYQKHGKNSRSKKKDK